MTSARVLVVRIGADVVFLVAGQTVAVAVVVAQVADTAVVAVHLLGVGRVRELVPSLGSPRQIHDGCDFSRVHH